MIYQWNLYSSILFIIWFPWTRRTLIQEVKISNPTRVQGRPTLIMNPFTHLRPRLVFVRPFAFTTTTTFRNINNFAIPTPAGYFAKTFLTILSTSYILSGALRSFYRRTIRVSHGRREWGLSIAIRNNQSKSSVQLCFLISYGFYIFLYF